MVRLVKLATLFFVPAALAKESCLSSDPECAGDADDAALLQRAVQQHMQNQTKVRGYCTQNAPAAATCGNPGGYKKVQ